ncbi:DNA alkylation repair protein [Sorangium cellulosum]|uniref:DNA alkylation repair protein n=1 Tax=Sorangium cellulosum TaxID=56 RepID=UPI0023DDED48|nr:DNA alkylation repair protein [Sorangium cellulosum]
MQGLGEHGIRRTGDPDARLLATLVFKPKVLSADELDAMVREIGYPKLLDWSIVNVVKASRHVEELRVRWKDSASALVGRAGWSLTTDRVVTRPAGLDLPALLDQIEAEMKTAPGPKRWSMNHCLAEIGIRNPASAIPRCAPAPCRRIDINYPA